MKTNCHEQSLFQSIPLLFHLSQHFHFRAFLLFLLCLGLLRTPRFTCGHSAGWRAEDILDATTSERSLPHNFEAELHQRKLHHLVCTGNNRVSSTADKSDLIVAPELHKTAGGPLSKRVVSSLPHATCSVGGLSTLHKCSFSTIQAFRFGSNYAYYQTYAKLLRNLACGLLGAPRRLVLHPDL